MESRVSVRTWIPLACLGLLGLLAACGNGDEPAGYAEPGDVDLLAYGVSQIHIPVDENRPPAMAETLIRQAARALADGEDFAAVARGRSGDGSAKDGGFLGFVRVDGDTGFGGAVQSLKPGEVGPPINTRLGWHIIKRHTFDEARELEQKYRIPTHGVFVAWDDPRRRPQPGVPPTGRNQQQAVQLAESLMQELASGAKTWDDAMALYTPEKRRNVNAYVGPTARRGANDQIFDALSKAKVGQLVGPFDTPEGVAVLMRGKYLRSLFRHILIQHVRVEDRDMSVSRTPEQAYALAEKALKEARADRSRWKHLVEKYSDDKWSRAVGGRMGVLHPGGMPRGFESFAFDQAPDTIHPKVVETGYGFHIVWKVN